MRRRLIRFYKRYHADLYHVAVPLVLSLLMAPSSVGGAALFLAVWTVVRWSGNA